MIKGYATAITAGLATAYLTVELLEKYSPDTFQKIQCYILRSHPKWFMKSFYNAIPCTDKSLIYRFNQIQKEVGITKKILLFETPENKTTLAFYNISLQAVCICTNRFSKLPPIAQSFGLYHELRHHLQSTTQEAGDHVKAYKESNDMSYKQASEYDADIFALERCAKLTNCEYCLRTIVNVHSYSKTDKNYTELGYITMQGARAHLDKQPKKNFYTTCDYHMTLLSHQYNNTAILV